MTQFLGSVISLAMFTCFDMKNLKKSAIWILLWVNEQDIGSTQQSQTFWSTWPFSSADSVTGVCEPTLVNGCLSEKTSDSEPWTAKNELKTSLLCFSGNFRWSFISCPLVTHYFFAFMIVTSLSYNDPLSNNNIPHNFRVVQMIWSSPYGAHSQI